MAALKFSTVAALGLSATGILLDWYRAIWIALIIICGAARW